MHGEMSLETGTTLYNIGIILEKQNRLKEALEKYQKARDIDIKCLGETHARTKDTDRSIARVQSKLTGKA